MIDDTYTDTYQSTDPLAWCRGLSLKRSNSKFRFLTLLCCISSFTSNVMMWDDSQTQQPQPDEDSYFNFDILSILSKPKDYYKILEVDYDATEDAIRSNYIRLALKWHPDKQKDEDSATSRFQDINEAYQVLSDPVRRREYDKQGMLHIYDYNISEYLNRYKGLILTCNGLGIRHSIW